MDERPKLSIREITRLEAMQRIKDKLLMQNESAQVINPSVW